MAITNYSLLSGILGVKLLMPAGDVVDGDSDNDDDTNLYLMDENNRLHWSIKLFENLHMDLSPACREHLNEQIPKTAKSIFEKRFHAKKSHQQASSSTNRPRPRTQENPEWSPLVDVRYEEVASEGGPTTSALVVVHRSVYDARGQSVMGRFFLPVRRGLFEVIVTAEDSHTGETPVRTLDMDSPEYDADFPNHCLSRVRKALNWLELRSGLTVTQLPPADRQPNAEVEIAHIGCRFVPPPRFLFCPNTTNPESNKYRFCRASFGGSDDVQMIVVSCWYVDYEEHKGKDSLYRIAVKGAKEIHESQHFVNMRIFSEEVSLTSRRRWLGVVSRDAIITVVDCEEARGKKRQNTIGWIREPVSSQIYLIYYADTLDLDQFRVRQEILDALISIRFPHRSVQKRTSWGAWTVSQKNLAHYSYDANITTSN